MRPNQQNRRTRGRNNNNNRRGPNPLNRSYESNGPDVKIRGSAQQVADKYAALARDAMGSGDRVMAESYLQHAEHYNRIIAAATAQMQAQRDEREDSDDNEDQDVSSRNNNNSRSHNGSSDDGSGPQPVIDGTPAEVALGDGQSENQPDRRTRRPRRRAIEQDDQNAPVSREQHEEASSREVSPEPAVSEKPEGDAPVEKPKRVRRTRKPNADAAGDEAGDNAIEAAE